MCFAVAQHCASDVISDLSIKIAFAEGQAVSRYTQEGGFLQGQDGSYWIYR